MREMENWKICEKECFEYLKKNFASEKFTFEADGGSDSTKSDILLKKNGIECFYIETKMNQAQSGQFVVLQNDEKKIFLYSPRNQYPENEQSRQIIEKMNERFDYYKNPGTKGIKLDLDKFYFYDWIFHNYTDNKNAKYFIIEKELGVETPDNFIIFPTQRLKKYTDANATYRAKRSGSANPSKKDFDDIKKAAKTEGFTVSNLHLEDKYTFCELNAVSATYKMMGENHKYQFKHETGNTFIITKLSKVCNANVIFDISLYQDLKQDKKDLDTFKAEFLY